VGGEKQFRLPFGERNDSLIREVMGLAKREGGQRPIVAVEEEARKWMGAVFPEIKLTADRDFFDYVYSAKDLAELPGKNYLRQRNHLNKFRRQYKYSVEDVAAETMEEVSRFLKRWCLWRDCSSSPMLEAEKTAILYCIEHFFELGLSGIVIRIGGEVQALSVYEPMNESTAAIHFEKAMPDFDGLYPAINNEAARLLAKRFQFIDRESDLGVAGLRTAKMRLHPSHMAEVYFLKKEDLP
jgi:hypothetical protein